MPLRPVKVKNAAQSNPMTMCEYLGHFKQARYLAMGHNFDGPAMGPSNLYRQGGDRIDTPDKDIGPASMIDQLLDQQPQMQYSAPPTVPTVRDPGRSIQLNPVDRPLSLAEMIGNATRNVGNVVNRI